MKGEKSQYDMLWSDAEEEFRASHPDIANIYDKFAKSLHPINFPPSKTTSVEGHGFHNTLIQTRVFLNRSREGRGKPFWGKLTKFLTILKKLSPTVGAVAAIDPVIAAPAWNGACILLQVC